MRVDPVLYSNNGSCSYEARLKLRWLAVLPVVLTGALVMLLFVPIVVQPGSDHLVCSQGSCIAVRQYDSISYRYGGWGAYYQTGVNYYTVREWVCSCPQGLTNCCLPPLGGQIRAILAL